MSTTPSQWEQFAHLYLCGQHEGRYFVEPKTSLELAHNIDMQQKLLIKQFAQIRHFLETNADVLKEVSELVLSKGKLNKDDLAPFLAKVQVPEDFPRVFESDWAKDEDSLSAADGMPLRD